MFGIGVNPDGDKDMIQRKERKKEHLLMIRSKEYKKHRAIQLEESKKNPKVEQKNKFINKVTENISEFNRESLITEDNVDVLRSIVKDKSDKTIKIF